MGRAWAATIGRPRSRAAAIALARSRVKTALLGPMPEDARAALLADLPKRFCRVVDGWEDAQDLIVDRKRLEREPLVWGCDRIGIGTLKALREGRRIEFTNEPSPIESVAAATHLVVCEEGEPLSEVIAANYAFALSAGLTLDPRSSQGTDQLNSYGLYGLQDPGDLSPTERLQDLTRSMLACCHEVRAPKGGSITFVTSGLPFGIGYADVPTTHLFTYPDLGICVINGISAEQPEKLGVEIAVLVDPCTTPS